MIAHDRTRSPGGAPSALALDYRVEPRRSYYAAERDGVGRVVDAKRQADARKLLARLDDWLAGEGLRLLPCSQHRILQALAAEMRRMGGKLGTRAPGAGVELEADLSARRAAELAAVDPVTAWRALADLKAPGWLEAVGEDSRAPKQAQRWRVGAALWREILGEDADAATARSPRAKSHLSIHTTTSTSTSFEERNSPPSSDDTRDDSRDRERNRSCSRGALIDETLAGDCFTYGQRGQQARLHGLNESARKIVVALAQGTCSPGELVLLTGCSRATIFRALDRLERRGMITRTRRSVALVPDVVERACQSTRRRDDLRKIHRGEREDFARVAEAMEAAQHGEELAAAHRERRRHGHAQVVPSAFRQAPETDLASRQPCVQARQPEPVVAPQPLVIKPEAAPKRPVARPAVRELVIPSADALRESRELLEALAARHGVRSVPDDRAESRQAFRRRHEHDAPRCRHDEALSECGICAQSLTGVYAVTLGGRVLDPDDAASWTKQPIEPRAPLEIASEHAEIAAARRRAAA